MAINDGDWITYLDNLLLDYDIKEDEWDRKFAAADRDWPKAQAEGLSIAEWREKYGLDPDWGTPLTDADKRSVEKYQAYREAGLHPVTGKPVKYDKNILESAWAKLGAVGGPPAQWGAVGAVAIGAYWFFIKKK